MRNYTFTQKREIIHDRREDKGTQKLRKAIDPFKIEGHTLGNMYTGVKIKRK